MSKIMCVCVGAVFGMLACVSVRSAVAAGSVSRERAVVEAYRAVVVEVARDEPSYWEDGLSGSDAVNALPPSELILIDRLSAR